MLNRALQWFENQNLKHQLGVVATHRRHLSCHFNPLNPQDVQQVLEHLLQTPPQCPSSAQKWFELYGEFSCAMSEAWSILELLCHLHPHQSEILTLIRDYEFQISPLVNSHRDALMRCYLDSPLKVFMHSDDRSLLERDFRFRLANSQTNLTKRLQEESELVREYRGFFSNSKLSFLGRVVSAGVVVGKLQDSSEEIRKRAYFTYWEFVGKNQKFLQQNFSQLLEVRRDLARVSGRADYVQYAFTDLGRMDYSPDQCQEFRNSILECVVPLVTVLHQKMESSNPFKPWNANHWPHLIPPLKQDVCDTHGFIKKVEMLCLQLGTTFHASFKELVNMGGLDIVPRSTKSPGAFCVSLHESRIPFVFGNFSPSFKELMVILHEIGHSMHVFFSRNVSNVFLRQPGLDFCEVAGIGFELLSGLYFDLFLDSKDVKTAKSFQLHHILSFWPFMAMIDGFQHHVYSSESSGDTQRNEIWKSLSRQYRPYIDWSDAPEFEELGWFSRHHVFTNPFYYFEYGVAQLGAIQLWLQSTQNPQEAIRNYSNGLALGAQRSLPELFASMKTHLRFDSSFLRGLIGEIALHLEV